ncbi:MAG: 2-amino-4-hydroxy-6-hydroxymethyldihydropteridine diphosphokinase [Candidatus Humimicrobiaceae bacterium]
MIFKIFVKNLKLFGYHGVNPEEKIKGQYFIFNVEINILKDSFKGNDDLSQTVNYSEVVRLIKEINSANKFDLIETLAEEISFKISGMSLLIKKIKTRIEKINPPIDEKLDSVGVEFKLEVKDNCISSQKEEAVSNFSITDDAENKELSFKVKKAHKKYYGAAYLSIGTNKGNRMENIKKVLYSFFKSDMLDILEVSSLYETEPMYYKDQDNFYNLVVKAAVKNPINPFVVLGYVKSIEYEMGREMQPVIKGPRIIDIDILSIDDLKIYSDILKLPHPGLPERNFVLVPLSEISPDYLINGIKINEFIRQKNFPQKVSKINMDMIIL